MHTMSFRHLEVYSLDADKSLDIAAADVSAAKMTAAPKTAQPIYELESDSDVDLAFIVFCFFEDLHCVQNSPRETWTMYQASILDHMTATTNTNTALDLVGRVEENIMTIAPTLVTKPRSYEGIAPIIFYADSLRHGDDPEEQLSSSDSL